MYPPPMGCPHPQQYGAPGPSYAPQPYAAQPQHHAQQYTQPQPFQPHHHYYNSPLAIPAPVQRVEYQAPVFKTFQERKREREALLVGTPPPTPPQRPRAPVPPSPSHRVPSYQQPPPSPIRQPPSPHQNRSVSPAALAMLGRSGERPLPPPRAPTRTVTPMSQQSTGMQPIGQQSTGMPPIQKQPAGMVYAPQIQQQPTGIPQQLQQQPRGMGYAPMQNHPSGNAPAMPRAPPSSSPLSHTVSPAQISRNVSPAPQIELSSRSVSPAPPPPEITLARSASPAHQVPTIVVPASPSPAMPQIVTPNASSPPISHINPRGTPPVTSPPMNPRALPHPKAPVERSDTIASVKSLDRAVGMKRTLPQLPVGVSPSRSLDRGPTQETPAQLAHRMAGVSIGGIVPSRVPRRGFRASNVVAPTALSISVASPPSKPINLGDIIPAINVASPRTSTIATIVMPAISVGSTPTPTVSTISVGSPPTPTVPAINVPTISVGSPPTPSVPAISVGSPPTPTLPSIPVGAPAPSIKAPEAAPRPPPSPPGVAFTPLPTIEVESGDTRYSSIGHRIQPSAAILCAGCSNPIIGRINRITRPAMCISVQVFALLAMVSLDATVTDEGGEVPLGVSK
ncbi:uncharacterized protein CcaverHIS019_0301790 [Cutaneotrichosporon cavernicola]|uniref:Uncharacterized protein n=1 Tax=Cutaneotrichosporon cavernicola TaxID=279322 RepID=A0AA48KZ57_9TREE|nr:uncharacterized protein CcaverHIS019_0301790 [Cutaneotrichosporon cavernicola]BEI90109.1 hypothetical protein CcaverHIS019_0301790 [Cutaneotrichosporon cavernicola]